MSNDSIHGTDGRFAGQSFEAVYAEIKRLDQLRVADQTAVAAALAASEKAVVAALAASEKAVNKAELAQSNVNITQNEFRGSLKDQQQTLMPRNEAENTFRELRGLIASQVIEFNTLRSRVDVGPPTLSVLQQRSDENVGRGKQGADTRTILIAVATIGAGILGTIIGFIIPNLK